MQESYYIAPDVEIVIQQTVLTKTPKQNKVRLEYFIVSHSDEQVKGNVSLVVPPGFAVLGNSEQFFSIYSRQGQIGRSFDLEWTGNKAGTFPFEFRIKRGASESTSKEFLTVETLTEK